MVPWKIIHPWGASKGSDEAETFNWAADDLTGTVKPFDWATESSIDILTGAVRSFDWAVLTGRFARATARQMSL